MIDPDYTRPLEPRRTQRPTPYASPLPAQRTITARLPGKPVQNMPPSPHRQGRRGGEVPVIRDEEMNGPLVMMSLCLFGVCTIGGLLTWGLGLIFAPLLSALFAGWGVRWSALAGRVTCGQACGFALKMTLAAAALPACWVFMQTEWELWYYFGALVAATWLFGCAGGMLATIGTGSPRHSPFLGI